MFKKSHVSVDTHTLHSHDDDNDNDDDDNDDNNDNDNNNDNKNVFVTKAVTCGISFLGEMPHVTAFDKYIY